jgi:REP element-mobilizing transposase RayT
MTIRTRHEINEDTWFVTFTCHDWLPLFELTDSYDLVYKWLKLIDDKYQIKTTGFVIMPNHVHVLLYLTNLNVNLNTIMANAKRFMAYDLVKRLTEQKHTDILNILASACSEKERAKGQLHKAFEPSFDAKPVYTIDFLYQKLYYIHHNPVSGKWQLSNEFTDYAHSSAAFYEVGIAHPLVNIYDYRNYWFG